MLRTVELSNVEGAFVLNDSSLVVIDVEIVWRGEDSHEAWEVRLGRLTVHAVSASLSARMFSVEVTTTCPAS